MKRFHKNHPRDDTATGHRITFICEEWDAAYGDQYFIDTEVPVIPRKGERLIIDLSASDGGRVFANHLDEPLDEPISISGEYEVRFVLHFYWGKMNTGLQVWLRRMTEEDFERDV